MDTEIISQFTKDTKMEKVFDAVASHIGSDKSVLIFLLDGKKISGGKEIL